MRVRTEEQVARRAMVVRRFLRAVPRRGIEVSLFWLAAYGCAMALVGVAVSLPLVLAFAQWAVTHGH